MGSLGWTKSVNEMMLKSLRLLNKRIIKCFYVTGKPYFEEMKTKLGKLNKNIKLVPYIDDMPSVLKNTPWLFLVLELLHFGKVQR